MLAAMMLPLLAYAVRHVRDRSFAAAAGARDRAVPRRLWRDLDGGGGALLSLAIAAATLADRLVCCRARLSPSSRSSGSARRPSSVASIAATRIRRSPPPDAPPIATPSVRADARALVHRLLLGADAAARAVPRGHVVAMAAVSLWLMAERLDSPAPPCWRLRFPAGRHASRSRSRGCCCASACSTSMRGQPW